MILLHDFRLNFFKIKNATYGMLIQNGNFGIGLSVNDCPIKEYLKLTRKISIQDLVKSGINNAKVLL